nr:MAG TPA: hypothetical protein [Caudoviricetes sp.]DAN23244.1 MAG TPA_asm: hypothetical protein [Bacteriophage sp.]
MLFSCLCKCTTLRWFDMYIFSRIVIIRLYTNGKWSNSW